MRIRRGIAVVAVLCTTVAACNQLFGIEDANRVDAPSEGGTTDVAIEDRETGGPDADAGVDATQPEQWLFVSVKPGLPPAGSSEVTIAQPAGAAASLVGRLILPTGDSVAYASGGRAFVLNRQNGDVFVLDRREPTNLAKVTRIAGGAGSNPYAVAVVSDTQAYVIRYGSNGVLLVDLSKSTGGVIPSTQTIDLSMFAGTNPDGKVDMAAAVYVPAVKRVYIALQRIEQTFPAKCAGGSIVVAIDTTTNTIADLNGDTRRDKDDFIKLDGENPLQLTFDDKNKRLLALNAGCAGDAGTTGRGVAEVKYLDRTSKALLAADPGDVIAHVYIDDTFAYVQLAASGWRSWDPKTGLLGANAGQMPSAPFVDGQGFIVGLTNETATKDASAAPVWDIFRLDKQAQLGGPVLPNAFMTVNAANVYLLSSAIIQ